MSTRLLNKVIADTPKRVIVEPGHALYYLKVQLRESKKEVADLSQVVKNYKSAAVTIKLEAVVSELAACKQALSFSEKKCSALSAALSASDSELALKSKDISSLQNKCRSYDLEVSSLQKKINEMSNASNASKNVLVNTAINTDPVTKFDVGTNTNIEYPLNSDTYLDVSGDFGCFYSAVNNDQENEIVDVIMDETGVDSANDDIEMIDAAPIASFTDRSSLSTTITKQIVATPPPSLIPQKPSSNFKVPEIPSHRRQVSKFAPPLPTAIEKSNEDTPSPLPAPKAFSGFKIPELPSRRRFVGKLTSPPLSPPLSAVGL
ncbi:hypothetical protein ABG067_007942, partial [Albugo candida]